MHSGRRLLASSNRKDYLNELEVQVIVKSMRNESHVAVYIHTCDMSARLYTELSSRAHPLRACSFDTLLCNAIAAINVLCAGFPKINSLLNCCN
jgi:hypothetical protein